MFDSEALKAWYASNPTDMEWLEKPSWHQFRWRLPNDRWVTASRQMTNQHSLGKVLAKHGPRDVYIGTSSWLNPINLPKLSDEEQAHPILLDHLIVFDIDFRPFCYRRLEQARTATSKLLQWLDMHEELNLCSISFSGGKGFHLILSERDRALFSIPDPKEREEAVRASRQALLERVLEAGFPVDPTVTADTRRIIRLPGSLHGTTGWCCHRITREELQQPLKRWKKKLPRHASAMRMPYWPLSLPIMLGEWKKRRRLRNKSSSPQVDLATEKPTIMSLQLSSQVVGTKERSAAILWIPKRWTEEHLERIAEVFVEKQWTPAYDFSIEDETLVVIPRAIPIHQLRKVLRTLGFPHLSSEIKRLGHYWIDVSPVKPSDGPLQPELTYQGLWREVREIESKVPWSATHLEMLKRLGLEIETTKQEVSGRAEPALRMVVKE